MSISSDGSLLIARASFSRSSRFELEGYVEFNHLRTAPSVTPIFFASSAVEPSSSSKSSTSSVLASLLKHSHMPCHSSLSLVLPGTNVEPSITIEKNRTPQYGSAIVVQLKYNNFLRKISNRNQTRLLLRLEHDQCSRAADSGDSVDLVQNLV